MTARAAVRSSFAKYHRASYVRDLALFAAAAGLSPAGRKAPPSRTGESQAFELCDAGCGWLKPTKKPRLSDGSSFAVCLFLDAALLAAVHAYDNTNYRRYVASLFAAILVTRHEGGDVRRPQALLALLSPFKLEAHEAVIDGCRQLVPEWAKSYSRLVREADAGRRVVEGLAQDSDITMPALGVPKELLNSVRAGLAVASALLAAQGKSKRSG